MHDLLTRWRTGMRAPGTAAGLSAWRGGGDPTRVRPTAAASTARAAAYQFYAAKLLEGDKAMWSRWTGAACRRRYGRN